MSTSCIVWMAAVVILANVAISTSTDFVECFDNTGRREDNKAYNGTRSVTVNGKTCIMWDGRRGVSGHNYCRSLDGEVPWCYVAEKGPPVKRWALCDLTDLPPCTTVNGNWAPWGSWTGCSKTCGTGAKTRSRTCTNPAPAHGGQQCHGSKSESSQCNTNNCPNFVECFDNTGRREDNKAYIGTRSVTVTGKTCNMWNGRRGVSGHNYCRSPDGLDRPWCYVAEKGRKWELCDLTDLPPCTTDVDIPKSTLEWKNDQVALTITPASIILGHTKDLTFTCKVLDPSRLSQVTFLRMSKVHPGGSSTRLVDLLPKFQQDDRVKVYDEHIISRSQVTGNLDKGQGDLYLKLTIPKPVKEDAGTYHCLTSFKGNNNKLGQFRITGSLHEVDDFSSLLQKKSKLQAAVDSCTDSSTHASLLSNTLTSPSLQLSFSPNNVLENATSPNVNLTCNAVLRAKVDYVTIMIISKVMANGSVEVPLVEMIHGSPQPNFLHPGDFQSRSTATGDLRVSHPVNMQVQIRRPKTADTGLYRCEMSYVGTGHVVMDGSSHIHDHERLNVWSWESLLAEIDRLKQEKLRKCSTSP